MRQKTNIQRPPFPELKLNGFWEGEDLFPSWAGFKAQPARATPEGDKRSDGRATISVRAVAAREHQLGLAVCILAFVVLMVFKRLVGVQWLSYWWVCVPLVFLFVLMVRGGRAFPPTAEQVATYEFLKSHEKELAAAVMAGIFKDYPKMRDWYGADDEDAQEQFGQSMPVIKDAQELKNLIELSTVHVLNMAKDGKAYLGFEFQCAWDDEHAFGVMTHGMRTVEIGIANAAFEEQYAARDRGEKIRNGK